MESSHKILLADDSPLFRDLEALFLARSGEIITADDGERALVAVRRERPAVAVLDVGMSGLPGDALCRVIKTDPELSDMPVILVVGGDAPEDRERAVRAGADDVIAKPINRITLVQAVNRCLRGPRPPGLTRVPLETPVHMRHSWNDAWGTSRNLSRGGIFVQTAETLPLESEVELYFVLPDSGDKLTPTAMVVWRRPRSRGMASGIGLQFLKLDRSSTELIEDFVHQNAGLQSPARALYRSTHP